MLMAAHRRGPWSQQEDDYLMSLVHEQGPLNWVRISQQLTSRTPKQCRERYHQNLKPSLNHDPITPEEGEEIERLVRQIGKRWAEIARRLNNRSDNAVKNWWNGNQNRIKRSGSRRRASAHSVYSDYRDSAPYYFPHHAAAAAASSSCLPSPGLLRQQQHVPAPLSPPPHFLPRPFDTPMHSPSALSPGAESDTAPSLMTDGESLCSTSPRSATVFPYSPTMTLPPLRNVEKAKPRYSSPPEEPTAAGSNGASAAAPPPPPPLPPTNLPGVATLSQGPPLMDFGSRLPPAVFGHHRVASRSSTFGGSEDTSSYIGSARASFSFSTYSASSQLPTAPNSPRQALPSPERSPSPPRANGGDGAAVGEERRTRVDVADLLA